MIPLRDQWQQLRQQRQQQIYQRRHQVQGQIQGWHQERSEVAIATSQSLQNFVSVLQTETADFLAAAAETRQAKADQLLESLQRFRETLQADVAHRRFENQQMLAQMGVEVQAYLTDCQQQRQAQSIEMMAELADYVETLQQTVSTFLSDVAEQRQQQASELKQKLQQDRQQLRQATRALMDQLAESRQARHHQVWGDAVVIARGTNAVVPTGRRGIGQKTVTPRVSVTKSVSPKLVTQRPAKGIAKPTSIPKAIAKPSLAIPPQSKANPESKPASASAAPAPAVEPVAALENTSELKLNEIEQAVYEYLQDSLDGAKVMEIEKALGIQRLKTVDALRSLLKQRLIAQKDRMYFIQ